MAIDLPSLDSLLDLAGERAGSEVAAASDEFFAEKENLIKAADPVFVAGKYTDRGKWMDGWETRRRRGPGHDWAVVRLGIPGIVRAAVIDTRFFTGNYPEQCSLEGCTAAAATHVQDLSGWQTLFPKSPLHGDAMNPFEVAHSQRFTHVRLNIFPDGGVARLRVYGEARPDRRALGTEIDLAAADRGGAIVSSSDQHYGRPLNLIMPGTGRDMSDGWETRRRRGPGHDWVVIRLAAGGKIERVEVDTSHFKGNFPDACSLDLSSSGEEGSWTEVLPPRKLQADASHIFEIASAPPARFARFAIYPDGGVSRLRLFGRLTDAGRIEANLAALNSAPPASARSDFMRCCGSSVWAERMEAGRPHASVGQLEATADKVWQECSRNDWLEAFAAHPAIGERTEARWSQQEQSRATGASPGTARELEELNRRYRGKFGFTFIVCATGKTLSEVLESLRRRVENSPEREIANAAAEQRLITRLRIRKLLSE